MAGDPLLSDPSRKRKRSRTTSVANRKQKQPARNNTPREDDDEEITSASDDDETGGAQDTPANEEREIDSDEEFADESAADKRRRLAKQYLENLKEEEIAGGEYDAQDIDDDILARRLQYDAAEDKGHVYKFIADKIGQQLEKPRRFNTRVGSKNITDVAIRYPYAYTVSKDMEIIKWHLNLGKKPQRGKHTKGGARHFTKKDHHCDQINCVAVSPDGRYVVTGGNDSRLIIWSSENFALLKVLDTRGAVNAITFRRNTDQLYAACSDLRVRTFSINQHAQLEILYGHQDNITDISALAREACVSVGSRDKTAMFWKIADESRLTFRGGDSLEKSRKKSLRKNQGPEAETEEPPKDEPPFFAEGSIDSCCMVDESHFVTCSENGNVALWSLGKKKALHTVRVAHGLMPQFKPSQASAESSELAAALQVPERQPYWPTSIYAIPYSDLFVTGSISGEIRLWRIDREKFRDFSLLGVVGDVKGCVVGMDGYEDKSAKKVVLIIATSKEHKFGRWLGKIDGARNNLTTLEFDI